MVEVTFQNVRNVNLRNQKNDANSRQWFEMTITDSDGEEHTINCFPTADNEIPVIFNPGMERKENG
jgi:hypothetical protein